MKQAVIIHLLLAVASAWLSGCASVSPSASSRGASAPSASGSALGTGLVASFVHGDAKTFVGLLPETLREEFSEQSFADARRSLEETLGEPLSYQYETRLAHPVFAVDLWKVRFSHLDSDGRRSEREALFRVITGTLDGKAVVVSFNFL